MIEIVCQIGTLSTILQHFTYNEIQWPTAARRWQFALRDVSRRQSCHLSTPSHPRVPPVWPYCRQAQCGRWRSLKWSIADLLTSSHPQMSASHLLGLQVRANGPSLKYEWNGHAQPQMVGFYDLVGVGIAPVSKKLLLSWCCGVLQNAIFLC